MDGDLRRPFLHGRIVVVMVLGPAFHKSFQVLYPLVRVHMNQSAIHCQQLTSHPITHTCIKQRRFLEYADQDFPPIQFSNA